MQLRLPPAEHRLLASLLPQLRAVFDGDAEVEHLRGRLFPPAYDDARLEAEFRELVGDDLVAQRHGALDTVRTTLERGRARPGRWSVDLDADEAQAWLSVLHDLRLVLAQIVGIETEADWERDPDTAGPEQLVLWHVGLMQEELLDVVASDLDDA